MNKKIFIAIVASMGMLMSFACMQKNTESKKTEQTNKKVANVSKPSNGIFEIISFGKDSLKFKAVVETKFYALAFVSGDQIFEGKSWSNAESTVRWANGSQFWAGSSMSMPAAFGVDAMTLPEGIVMTVYRFGVPDNLKVAKIRFLTEEDSPEMYYNISKSSWDK
jgi:hypothetical protein